MAAALRQVRRLQVLLVPRISGTHVRAESGGKGSVPKENIKTLVSFPVKVSYFQQDATGENRNEPLRSVTAPLLDVGGSGGQSDTETQLGQDVSHSSTQSTDGTSHKVDDSSSSSSDSSSDSESEDNEPVTDLQSNGGHKRVAPTVQKSSFISGHMSLEKESPKDGMRGENARDPVMTTEEQSLPAAPLPTKMNLLGSDKMKILNRRVPTEEASSTAADDSGKMKVLSTSEVTPAGAVETQILSASSSEEIPTGGTLAPQFREMQILSTSSSSEITAVETSTPESGETQILSTSSLEEIPTGGTLASQSGEIQILLTTASEELPADVHESCSPPEPNVAPQEPFDNTKYQNLQHLTYTPFTFVDVDVELATFRLPQPSSGRPSPRH